MRITFNRGRGLACAMVLGVLTLGGINGCGEETIDASSETAFQQSIERMTASLETEAEKERFQEAVGSLMASEVLFAPGDVEVMQANMKKVFHGKTADEIVAAGEKADAEAQAEMQKLLEE